MKLSNDFLYIPVKLGTEEKYLEIFADGEKIFEFTIPEGNTKASCKDEFSYDYVVKIDVREYKGKDIVFQGEFSKGFFENLETLDCESDKVEARPQVHFTARYGWINDPNGLVYHKGIYHLYFQHNPFNIQWQNMSWGHATSKDLLTWEWQDDVMFPDENGTIFSGCGVEKDGELLFPYTVAGDTSPWSKGKTFYQGLAVSRDDGMTLQKQKTPFLEELGKDSRDPKIFWHPESDAYIMVLYLEKNDFGIFRSKNLLEWQQTQKLCLKKDGAWECPDLMRVPCINGEDAWMFWCADGFYYWGSFDGYCFQSDFTVHHAYLGENLYATQTYFGIENRIVAVPWLRFKERNGICYQGAMGLPKEYTCRRDGDDIVLLQNDIREFTERLVETEKVPEKGVYVVDIEPDNGQVIALAVNGSDVLIDTIEHVIMVDDRKEFFAGDMERIRLVVDYNILEISFGNAIIGAYKIQGFSNSFAISWREHGNTEGCGSRDRTNCNYRIKSFK